MPRMTLAFHIWRSLVWWTLVSVCHETITYPCIFASGWIVEVVENYSNLRDLSNQKHLDLGGGRRHDFPHGDYNLVHSRTFRHPSGLWREMRRYMIIFTCLLYCISWVFTECDHIIGQSFGFFYESMSRQVAKLTRAIRVVIQFNMSGYTVCFSKYHDTSLYILTLEERKYIMQDVFDYKNKIRF